MPVPPPPPAPVLFCALVEEPPLVVEVVSADVLPFVADVCSTVLPVLVDPEIAPVCTELLNWLLAEVVASVEVLDVVALTPLVLPADNCEFVEEEDEVPLWPEPPAPPLLLEELLAVLEPCM